MRSVTAFCRAACVLAATAAGAAFGSENFWIGGVSNDWLEPANWSLGAVPEAMTDVTQIDRSPAVDSSVALNQSATVTVADLTIDAGDALTLAGGANLYHNGLFALDGALRLEDARRVGPMGPIVIGETGRLTLVQLNSGALPSLGSALGGRSPLLYNLGVIEGSGSIDTKRNLLNEGTIVANDPNYQLKLQTAIGASAPSSLLMTSTGLMRAENGATLLVDEGGGMSQLLNYVGGDAGRIEAGPNSLVDLRVTVVGGVLAADPAGEIRANAIQDVRVEGRLQLYGPFAGQIENTGQIIHGEASQLTSDATLTGGGELLLGDPAVGGGQDFLRINPSSVGFTRITNEDNTVIGRGTIDVYGGQFINRGVVDAGHGPDAATPGGLLRIAFNNLSGVPVVNSGVLSASGAGGLLRIEGNSFEGAELQNFEGSAAGVIEATGGGQVSLGYGTTIHGGVLRTDAQYESNEPPSGPVSELQFGFSSQPAILDSVRIEGHVGGQAGAVALRGRIENTGVLETQLLVVSGGLELAGGGMVVLAGSGRFEAEQGGTPADVVVTNRDNTLRLLSNSPSGSYQIILDNHGVVESVAGDGTSYAPGKEIRNHGLLVARAGSTLVLPSVEVLLGATAAGVHAEAGAVVSAYALRGGRLTTDASPDEEIADGMIVIDGALGDPNGSLRDIVNAGRLQIQQGNLGGNIVNNALIELTGSGSLAGQPTTLSGEGELRLVNRVLTGPRSGPVGLLTNAAGHRITGSGGMNAYRYDIVNNGAIIADAADGLTINLGTNSYLLQNGLLSGSGEGHFLVVSQNQSFTNRGVIEAASSGNNISSPWLINASGATIQVAGDLTANFLNNHTGSAITGHGELLLNDQTPSITSLNNAGLIAPDAGPEDLFVRGGFQQSATGELRIAVDGLTPNLHSVLRVSQLSSLGGTLGFDFADAIAPSYGDEIAFLMGPTEGVFDAVTGLPELGDGLVWAIDYQPYQVAAVAALPGDFNLDGLVDAADYATWRDNPRGQYNAADYDSWANHFGLTAPAATPANAPEPAALLLLAATGTWLLSRRRSLA
ncbi:hypothetical protein Pla123a_05480 [Posidoniimonas polymericola]|uniref:Autotransporter-associated beta strand repeat protein n=1 Tax=Posidoniimonas polymericola TaxID=2528002 RepID=A0A5C5ZFW1_9BACT|nr:hypothetical protein [Posidoniimonas polymericola]TWT85741.1 hypothetical protein Pla123a_05480 [Posidoniimonas polymericola]